MSLEFHHQRLLPSFYPSLVLGGMAGGTVCVHCGRGFWKAIWLSLGAEQRAEWGELGGKRKSPTFKMPQELSLLLAFPGGLHKSTLAGRRVGEENCFMSKSVVDVTSCH